MLPQSIPCSLLGLTRLLLSDNGQPQSCIVYRLHYGHCSLTPEGSVRCWALFPHGRWHGLEESIHGLHLLPFIISGRSISPPIFFFFFFCTSCLSACHRRARDKILVLYVGAPQGAFQLDASHCAAAWGFAGLGPKETAWPSQVCALSGHPYVQCRYGMYKEYCAVPQSHEGSGRSSGSPIRDLRDIFILFCLLGFRAVSGQEGGRCYCITTNSIRSGTRAERLGCTRINLFLEKMMREKEEKWFIFDGWHLQDGCRAFLGFLTAGHTDGAGASGHVRRGY